MTTPTRIPQSRFSAGKTATTCPYLGLVPFDESDVAYFFGRDRDTEIIVANLTAARLTLLYAASGVGKSSVLRAGVVPRLRKRAEEDHHEELGIARSAVAYVREWSSAPMEAAAVEIGRALGGADPPPNSAPVPSFGANWLRGAMKSAGVGVLYLIFDQFEEYLFHHPVDAESDELTSALSEILAARDLDVHVLLSVREDALAQLDRFKGRIPHLFGNYRPRTAPSRGRSRSTTSGSAPINRSPSNPRWPRSCSTRSEPGRSKSETRAALRMPEPPPTEAISRPRTCNWSSPGCGSRNAEPNREPSGCGLSRSSGARSPSSSPTWTT
jgi:hypothetical protein